MQDKGHHFNCTRHLYQWHYQDIWRDKFRPTLHKTAKARRALLSTHLSARPLLSGLLGFLQELLLSAFPSLTWLSEVWANVLRITEVLVE